jgi:transposase
VLKNPAYRFKRIGLEAGPLSQRLFSALAEAGPPSAARWSSRLFAYCNTLINRQSCRPDG